MSPPSKWTKFNRYIGIIKAAWILLVFIGNFHPSIMSNICHNTLIDLIIQYWTPKVLSYAYEVITAIISVRALIAAPIKETKMMSLFLVMAKFLFISESLIYKLKFESIFSVLFVVFKIIRCLIIIIIIVIHSDLFTVSINRIYLLEFYHNLREF